MDTSFISVVHQTGIKYKLMNIIKYYKDHLGAVFIVFALLVLVVFCDLSIPRLTSNIVDVGIQQSGVDDIATEKMTKETHDVIEAILANNSQDENLFKQSYSLDSSSSETSSSETSVDSAHEQATYSLNQYGKDHLQELEKALEFPLAAIYGASTFGKQDLDFEQVMIDYEDGKIDDAQLNEYIDEMREALSHGDKGTIHQVAISGALKEYKKAGFDLPSMQMSYLLQTGSFMIGLAAASMILNILIGLVASVTGARIGRALRRKLFTKVVSFSNAEINQFSAASLITRGTNDIQTIQMVCIMLLRMVFYAPIIAVGGIIMVLTTNAEMGWIIIVAIVIIFVVMAILFRLTLPKFKIMQKLIDRVNLVAREMLNGMAVIRAFNRQDYEQNRFDEASTNLYKTQLFTNRAMVFMMPTMMLIMNLTSIAIVWFGSSLVDMGSLQTGDLIAFITYAIFIIMGFLVIGMMAIMLPRANVASIRVNEVINTPLSIRDNKASVKVPKDTTIEFKNVSFSYDDESENAIENISFTVEPGSSVAIIGPTGSGKSTILKLIERFYDVGEGCISIGGVNVKDLSLNDLRSMLGYCPQKTFLFSGTIDTNVAYSDEAMSNKDVREALDIAQATNFVSEREGGIHSTIVQGGTNVSGGQRQRIAIARAIATKAPILLFDDSFSALDYKTDAALRSRLKTTLKGTTNIVVAQRIASVLDADKILVIDEGKLVGEGTNSHLMESCELYREIALSQLSEAELMMGASDD